MNRIAQLRKEHGYSQAHLAKLIGVAQNTISNWEQKKREPSQAELKKLAYHLDCSVDYLIGHTPFGKTFIFDSKVPSEFPLDDTDTYPDRPIENLSFEELNDLLEQLYQVLERVSENTTDSSFLINSGALIMRHFRLLNDTGKHEATKRTKELLSLSEYTSASN